jgi:sporulation protein YlmC with PRC-barrel domain
MKKTGFIFMAIFFIFALLIGQAFTQEMRTQYGAWETKQLNRASEFIGKNVKNLLGENIGKVDDIIFNSSGNINYLILSRGGFLGIGVELVPVPWHTENIDIQRGALIMNIDRQKLDEAPSFSRREWENIEEQRFQERVHGYFDETREEQRFHERQGQEGIFPDNQRFLDRQEQEEILPDIQLFPDRQEQIEI